MPSNFQVIKSADKESAIAEAGEALNQMLWEHKNSPMLLLLSGGSALSLPDYLENKALTENLTVSMLDERFIQDPQNNNFAQMQKTGFYARAMGHDVNFIDTLPRQNESLAESASRLERALNAWREQNPSGKIFASLGLGADGHTAGIFPFENKNNFDRLFNSENWAVGYQTAELQPFPERITATFTFFPLINGAVALVLGQKKASALKKTLGAPKPLNELPASGWRLIQQVQIFTDIG